MRGAERHTRQGRARGQRWGTLDRYDENTEAADMSRAHAATRHEKMNEKDSLQKPSVEALDKALGPIPRGSLFPCWCQGEICFRRPDGLITWPGKDQGAPHPRDSAS